MNRVQIFFCGASGVGKSALAGWASRQFGLPLFRSVNAQVYTDLGYSWEDTFTDPDKMYQAQSEIYARTLKQLGEMSDAGMGLAADRSIDLIPYTVELLGGREFYGDWGLERLVDIVRRPGSLVFLVQPCASVLEAARREDAGRRAYFLREEVVHRIAGLVEGFLEDQGIPFLTLDSPRFKDRARTVRRVVELTRAARGEPTVEREADAIPTTLWKSGRVQQS